MGEGLRISEAESQVMAVVWAAEGADGPGAEGWGAAGAEEILAAVGPANGWTESTVRTLIHRLIRKGALRSERRRGVVTYVAMAPRQDWVTAESQGLLDRLFGGQLSPLVDHFTRAKAIAPEDLARLKRLVAELDRDAEDEDG